MIRHLLIAVLLALFLGCEDAPETCPDSKCPSDCQGGSCPVPKMSLTEVPLEIRQGNYAGGSCMYASLVTALRWTGQNELADAISKYTGGETVGGLAKICDQHGILFAATSTGDESLLQWVSDTRRMAAIHWIVSNPSDHAITFAGYVRGSDGREMAALIDNNSPGRNKYLSKDEFLRIWHQCGGKALVPIYSPAPPPAYVAS